MNFNETLRTTTRHNPDSLLRLLMITAVISITVIIAVSGFGFYRVFSGFVIQSAEEDSVHVCDMLMDQQRDLLFAESADKSIVLGLKDADIPQFDRTLRRVLAPFHIIKVKVYDAGKKIVYSTETALIGKVDDDNRRLDRALSGQIDAKMVTKEKAHDLSAEKLFDVDVVETYVPIMSPDHGVVGSFEIYVNVTPYRQQIRKGATVMTLLMSLVIAGVFGVSYLLIRKGTTQLKEVQSKLEITARMDTLTGIANRGYLMERAEEEFARAVRGRKSGEQGGKSLCCIMIDLDHFKRINDTKGHLAGDQILKGVADRLRCSTRSYDLIGRFGGEEFAAFLPDTTFQDGMHVAERILKRIRGEAFMVNGEQIFVTVSLGFASLRDTESRLTDLLGRADEGLYRAKAEGRDRIASV